MGRVGVSAVEPCGTPLTEGPEVPNFPQPQSERHTKYTSRAGWVSTHAPARGALRGPSLLTSNPRTPPRVLAQTKTPSLRTHNDDRLKESRM